MDLSKPGIEPVSPALQGGFLVTTEPSMKVPKFWKSWLLNINPKEFPSSHLETQLKFMLTLTEACVCMYVCVCVCVCVFVQLCPTPWTVAHQVPLSMEYSRQEYWSGLLFPYSRGSSWPRERTQISCFGRWSHFRNPNWGFTVCNLSLTSCWFLRTLIILDIPKHLCLWILIQRCFPSLSSDLWPLPYGAKMWSV